MVAAIALLAVLFAATPAYAQAAARLVFLGTFENPTFVTVAPGEPDLLFVVERPGIIHLLRNEQRVMRPFLDIRDLVLGEPDPDAGNERGLLSMAFAPDYAQSGRFYVAFTNNEGDIEIDEFRRHPNNPDRANPQTRRVLLVIPHRKAANHNGGQLNFGPDGLLYISTGDGGHQTPSGEHARDLRKLWARSCASIRCPMAHALRVSQLPILLPANPVATRSSPMDYATRGVFPSTATG